MRCLHARGLALRLSRRWQWWKLDMYGNLTVLPGGGIDSKCHRKVFARIVLLDSAVDRRPHQNAAPHRSMLPSLVRPVNSTVPVTHKCVPFTVCQTTPKSNSPCKRNKHALQTMSRWRLPNAALTWCLHVSNMLNSTETACLQNHALTRRLALWARLIGKLPACSAVHTQKRARLSQVRVGFRV